MRPNAMMAARHFLVIDASLGGACSAAGVCFDCVHRVWLHSARVLHVASPGSRTSGMNPMASRAPAVSLKPELFEGMRFDFNKGLNQKFSLTHSIFMGSVEVRSGARHKGALLSRPAAELHRSSTVSSHHTRSAIVGDRAFAQVPSQGAQTIKIPASSYEFGSILVDGPLLMIGKIFTDGRMTGEDCEHAPESGRTVPFSHSASVATNQLSPPLLTTTPTPSPHTHALSGRIKYDVTNDLSMKLQTQLTKEKGYSQVMLDVDAKGLDWQARSQAVLRAAQIPRQSTRFAWWHTFATRLHAARTVGSTPLRLNASPLPAPPLLNRRGSSRSATGPSTGSTTSRASRRRSRWAGRPSGSGRSASRESVSPRGTQPTSTWAPSRRAGDD